MKKITAVILCLILFVVCMPLSAFAATSGVFGTDENIIYWSVSDGVLTISGNGLMDGFLNGEGKAPWSDAEFSSVVVEEGVLNIGPHAFEDCKGLKSVTLPESVSVIQSYAFKNCTNLTEIKMNQGLQAIFSWAFENCTGLTSVEIPDSVELLESAFTDCKNLKDIKIGDKIHIIDSDCFRNTAYYNDESNWENGALYMGSYLLEIKEDAPESIIIKEGTKTIVSRALSCLSNITSVSIPDSLSQLCTMAFYACDGLKEIKLGKNNEFFSMKYGVLFNRDYSELILYPGGREGAEYTVPDGVTTISAAAFAACFNLAKIALPGSLTEIENGAFYECTNLLEIDIPDSVTELGQGAFANCYKLRSAAVSSQVKIIFSGTFGACESLERVIFKGNPDKICEYAFWGDSNITDVYYPGTEAEKNKMTIGSENTYLENAKWHFNTDIASIPELPEKVKIIEDEAVLIGFYLDIPETYRYKTTIVFKVDVPEGTNVQWYLNGKPAGTGLSFEVKEATENYTVDVIATLQDNTQIKQHQEIIILNGFFDKIYWFFMHFLRPGDFTLDYTK